MQKLYYNFIKLLARVAVEMFYKPIEINGLENIPDNNPHLIFAPNHQSAFLDAVLVAVFSKRPIYFLTRADVFSFPFKYFLYSLNMMPVYRQRDGMQSLSKNEAVFKACRELVQDGKPILLFPEASQLLVHYLRPLSRGLSRIAYLSQENFDNEVLVIPVGINYFNHTRAGVKLILNFGRPISIKKLKDQYPNRQDCLNAIRDTCFERLANVMLIPEDDHTYDLKTKYLSSEYAQLNFEELKSLIQEKNPVKPTARSNINQILILLLSLPNLFFYLLEWLVLRFFVEDPTFIASIRVSLIMFVFPVHLLLHFLFAWSCFGMACACLLVMTQLSAYWCWLSVKSMHYAP